MDIELTKEQLELQEWQDARVRTALESANKGEGLIHHSEIVAWMATLK